MYKVCYLAGGIFTSRNSDTGVAYWWADSSRGPDYIRGWRVLGWSMIESIDGLEFV